MHAGISVAATVASVAMSAASNERCAKPTTKRTSKIEEALRANKGLPVTVDVTPILTEYRGLINGYSGELRTFVTDETAMLSDEFKLAPPGQGGEGGGRGREDPPEDPQNNSTKDGEGIIPDSWPPSEW